jgi:hypothetical protein
MSADTAWGISVWVIVLVLLAIGTAFKSAKRYDRETKIDAEPELDERQLEGDLQNAVQDINFGGQS